MREQRSLIAGRPIERAAHFVPLLGSSRLVLVADAFAHEVLRTSLPTAREPWHGKTLGAISARREQRAAPAAPEGAPTIFVGGISVWVDHPSAGHALLRNASGSVHGEIERDARRATVCIDPDVPEKERADAGLLLGLVVTLLVGHLGHAVMHAAAVVSPDGRAWLLVGDSRAGKSSATASLVAAGWDYLSDDAVILSPMHAGIRVEGWRSGFHLDRGFRTGIPTGDRAEFDPNALGAGQWRAAAPLGGLLFPKVRASVPTGLGPVTRAAAFIELVRQSPWLLADRGASPAVAQLLTRAAEYPVAHLSLGSDSFASPERLVAVLGELTAHS